MLIAVEAYWERRAWAAWATGLVARGAVDDMAALLPQKPESADERDARIDRAIAAWDVYIDRLDGVNNEQ